MRIDVITLFPDFIENCARIGVVGRARERGLLQIATWNPRDFATDNYRSADDRCYGGGPGMVMMIDPLRKALDEARAAAGPTEAKVIYLSPQGKRLDQAKVVELAKLDHLMIDLIETLEETADEGPDRRHRPVGMIGGKAAEEGAEPVQAAVDTHGRQADAAEALALVAGAVLENGVLDGIDLGRQFLDDVVDAVGDPLDDRGEEFGA